MQFLWIVIQSLANFEAVFLNESHYPDDMESRDLHDDGDDDGELLGVPAGGDPDGGAGEPLLSVPRCLDHRQDTHQILEDCQCFLESELRGCRELHPEEHEVSW